MDTWEYQRQKLILNSKNGDRIPKSILSPKFIIWNQSLVVSPGMYSTGRQTLRPGDDDISLKRMSTAVWAISGRGCLMVEHTYLFAK